MVSRFCKRAALAALVITLIAAAFTLPALGAGPETYTVTVKYYDDVMITYSLYYPSGGTWMGSGDIPIGGTELASQVFCADPFVAFHSLATTSWEGTTTDRMPGYAMAPPWSVSGALSQNYDAVRWLVMNGYRGNYGYSGGEDEESRQSVARLSELYPEVSGIDKRIALMATKVAIWKTLVGDSVEIIRTSLPPAQQAVFDELVEAMIADAQTGRYTGLEATGLSITIDENRSEAETADGYTYIPINVTMLLTNPGSGAEFAAPGGVYLTASGPDIDDVSFAAAEDKEQLATGVVYGTNVAGYYLEGSAFTYNGEAWTCGAYLKVPLDRSPANGDRLTVKAMGMLGDARVVSGTPITFVYRNGDILEWDHVQAYTGAAMEGVAVELYAEGSMHTGDTPLGSINVRKTLQGASASDSDTEFRFALYSSLKEDFSNPAIVDLTAHPVSGASGIDADSNTFTLRNGSAATIEGVPSEHYYRVIEVTAGLSGYEVPDVYLTQDSGAPGQQAALTDAGYCTPTFTLSDGSATVTFSNAKIAEAQRAHLKIGKIAIGLSQDGDSLLDMRGEEFEFTLQSRADGAGEWQPVDLSAIFRADTAANAPDGIFGGGRLAADGKDGRFLLSHYGQALLELDPGLEYRVLETENDDYASAYALGIFENGQWRAMTSDPGNAYWKDRGNQRATEAFTVSPDGYYQLVFTNVDVPSFDLTISKTVEGADNDENDDEFFSFEVIFAGGAIGVTPYSAIPLTTDAGYYNAMLVTGGEGVDLEGRVNDAGTAISLKHNESVTVTGLPAGHYLVRELKKDGYAALYSFDGGEYSQAADGETGVFALLSDTKVAFLNRVSVEGGEEGREDGGYGGGENGSGNGGTTDEPSQQEETDDEDRSGGTGDLHPNVSFPVDKSHEDYPGIDFRSRQPEQDSPGGSSSTAPPEAHNPEDKLVPQIGDDGKVYFIEIGPDGVPLGEWTWDDDENMWIFDAYTPLAYLPQTSGSHSPLWVLAFGLILLYTGVVSRGRYARDSKQ